MAAAVEDDSLSEASAPSDADDDADAEGSEGSDAGLAVTKESEAGVVANGHRNESQTQSQPVLPGQIKRPLATTSQDTETMINGLQLRENNGEQAEEVHFDDLAAGEAVTAQTAQPSGQPVEKNRREHEEYKKRRDADPAFVPNRGVFFMHDHRSSAPGQNGFRPFGRGRGRGRGNGSFPHFG